MRIALALGLAFSIAAILTGCSASSVSQPLPLGGDTYRISATSTREGPQLARASAVSAARQHCVRLSKNLLLLSSSSDIVRRAPEEEAVDDLEQKAVIDLTFRCLAAGDPGAGAAELEAGSITQAQVASVSSRIPFPVISRNERTKISAAVDRRAPVGRATSMHATTITTRNRRCADHGRGAAVSEQLCSCRALMRPGQ